MSVRSNILALLTLGPAYGLQLHSEIESRTARVGRINVGQIYSTLNRLVAAGLVTPGAGSRDDAPAPLAGLTTTPLPLYFLTAEGRTEAVVWMTRTPDESPPWDELVEHVLLMSTMPGTDLTTLVERYRGLYSRALEPADAGSGDLAVGAARHQARAALGWLAEVSLSDAAGELCRRGLSTDRPRRGRRPVQKR